MERECRVRPSVPVPGRYLHWPRRALQRARLYPTSTFHRLDTRKLPHTLMPQRYTISSSRSSSIHFFKFFISSKIKMITMFVYIFYLQSVFTFIFGGVFTFLSGFLFYLNHNKMLNDVYLHFVQTLSLYTIIVLEFDCIFKMLSSRWCTKTFPSVRKVLPIWDNSESRALARKSSAPLFTSQTYPHSLYSTSEGETFRSKMSQKFWLLFLTIICKQTSPNWL